MKEKETHSLVGRAIDGSNEAFSTLVERHAVQLLLFVRRNASSVLGGDCSAEDLLQSIFVDAWGALPRFEYRGPGSFHGWLIQIARHAISTRVKYQQAKGRDNVVALDRETDSGRYVSPELEQSMTSIVSGAARREQIRRLEDALSKMPDEQREVVELSFVEGRSVRELAEHLDIPKSSAWDRLRTAMKDLKEAIGDDS